jgi:mannose-6-phosphate isomerase-like protein (cupin superfamily)
VPPDGWHDPVGNGGTDLAVVSIVSPNLRDRRWQTTGFAAAAYDAQARRSHAGAQALRDERLEAEHLTLAPGEQQRWPGRRDVDRVVLVVEGEVEATIGPFRGALAAGGLAFVPARAEHALSAGGAGALVVAAWAAGRTG